MQRVVRLGVIVGLLFFSSCRPEPFDIDFSMILDSYGMSIYEPSGLSYSTDKESFYVVSDRGLVYQISLTGRTLKELPISGDDFEGITVDSFSSSIYIIEEGKGELLKFSTEGALLDSHSILDNPGNIGLEGLTYNRHLDEFYMLKEKSAGSLIKYSMTQNSKTVKGLSFAYDYSGIYYNNASDKLWIVSDESRTISQCSLDGNIIKSYAVPISGMEGIVVNDDETEAYVVSDPNNELYRIDLTGEYTSY